MNQWRIWGFVLLLLASTTAVAGQNVQTYYVDRALWNGSNNQPGLPHLRSVGEGCVAALRDDMQYRQAHDPNHNLWRYILQVVGQDNGFSDFPCTGEVDVLLSTGWAGQDFFTSTDPAVHGFSSPVNCVLANYTDTDNGQCGPPKCCITPVGNPIDAASGNKHEVETDYTGAGAFPLHFERTYDSSRTWLDNPVPIGVAWTHTYLASLSFMMEEGGSTIDQAVAYRPDGRILRFNLDPVHGVWVADLDVAERLSATYDVNGVPTSTATLTNTDDSVEQYDGIGRLISITNRDGLTQTLSYVTTAGTYANDVQKVTDPQGHTLTFGYNASGQLNSLTDGNGAVIQYGYDSATGNLTSVIYPDISGTTKTRNYLYNEAGQVPTGVSWPNALTGISEEITTGTFKRYASWGYDSDGRATSSVHGPFVGGTIDKTTLTFNTDGSTSFKDALGQTRKYVFNVQYQVAHPASLDKVCSACGANDNARSYDTNGYPATQTDFDGNQSTQVFTAELDSNGHPRGLETQRVEGFTPTNTAVERTINTQWDRNFREPDQRTVVDHAGTTEALTTWAYNQRGQATFRCEVDPAVTAVANYQCGSQTPAPVGVRQWAYTYCEQPAVTAGTCPLVGLKLTSADPLSNLTTYAYYPNTVLTGCATVGGACNYKGDLQTVTKAVTSTLNLVTTYVSYDGDGRPTRITDPNGVPTDLSYHPRGWITQSAVRGTNNAVTTDDAITKYTYDGAGQLTRVTQPDASYVAFSYDVAHRLYYMIDNLKNSILYTLDNAGNRKEDDSRTTVGTTTTIYRKVIRAYNALNQLANTQNANSTSSVPVYNAKYVYDPNGNIQQVTDGLAPAHVTVNTYDPLNRLTQTWQDKCVGTNCSSAVNAITDYTYDALDRLRQVQDPYGPPTTTTYQFDGLNNQTQLISPDTGTATSTFDAAGNLHTRTDARSTSVNATYGHDGLNRLTSIIYANTALNVSYRYDTYLAPDVACPTGDTYSIGRLTHFTDASGRTQFCYDRFGNMVYKSQTISGVPFVTSYAYDFAHHLTQITTPQGTLIAYTRDLTGRITGVTSTPKGQSTQTTVSNVTYYPFGPVASITYGNGRVLTRSYDQDYVVGSISDSDPATGGLALTFGRDNMRDLTEMQIGDSTSTVGNVFNYDGLYRLTSVTDITSNHNQIAAYTIDSTGNRLTKQATSTSPVSQYTYPAGPTPPASHRLIAVDSTARGYDAIGDTTSIGSGSTEQTFYYDATARMTQMRAGSPLVLKMQYLYNARGERVRKYLGSTTTSFTVHDESGHVLGDYTSASVPIRELVWMDDLPVGVLNGSTGALAYIEPDHLGTPRVAIDSSLTHNVAIWTWSPLNDPFGETQPKNVNGSTLVLNNRFPGQVYDFESGLNYNYFRDYDSGTGRYVESDPIGLSGGIATYGYTLDTPILDSDAEGLQVVPIRLPGITVPLIPWPRGMSMSAGTGESGTQDAASAAQAASSSCPTCAKSFPGMDLCSELRPMGYWENSENDARAAVFGPGTRFWGDANIADPGYGACSHPVSHRGIYTIGLPRQLGYQGAVLGCRCCEESTVTLKVYYKGVLKGR